MVDSTLAEYSGIHSMVPVDKNPQGGVTWKYDERREKILLYLIARKGQVRTAWKIASACGLPNGETQPLVRKLIKEINHVFAENNVGAAVVSTNKGFFYTDNPEDIKRSIDMHYQRMQGLGRTIRDEKAILARFGIMYGGNSDE